MQPKIILVNPDLTYAAPPQMLQGFSGRTYATTRWNAAYNCHTVEMSPQEYEACWDDLRRAIHFQMRRWFPRFIVPERPLAFIEFEAGYDFALAGRDLPEDASKVVRAGHEAARETLPAGPPAKDLPTAAESRTEPDASAASAKVYAEAELRRLGRKDSALVPIATALGLDSQEFKGSETLIKAILESKTPEHEC